ncbi:helix-turn-helix transcriptional regulator [Stenotrophomonas muris]|uniref:helix-turn-helix domain-containing protein n=1 Tax=Stenotrophomonas muris TaxID=2963283 RepID=UPI00300E76F5
MAARLRQARVLRGLSQREVGVRMGMDKDTASARISRYESEGMSISLEALFELAQALEVPPAYLLATSPAMADAILALGEQSAAQQERFAELLGVLGELSAKKRNTLIEKVLSPTKD